MDTFLGSVRARTGVALAACLACLLSRAARENPRHLKRRKQRGDEIVKRMSDHLAQAKTFTVETTDTRTRSRGGKEITVHTTRQLTVRRPDRLAVARHRRHGPAWLVRRQQADARLRSRRRCGLAPTPPPPSTTRSTAWPTSLAMPMPMADFLYSSPYDALIGTKSTGGYVGSETVGGVACHHVAYKHPAVDWELWIPESGDPLPKKFVVTNKTSTTARGRPK